MPQKGYLQERAPGRRKIVVADTDIEELGLKESEVKDGRKPYIVKVS